MIMICKNKAAVKGPEMTHTKQFPVIRSGFRTVDFVFSFISTFSTSAVAENHSTWERRAGWHLPCSHLCLTGLGASQSRGWSLSRGTWPRLGAGAGFCLALLWRKDPSWPSSGQPLQRREEPGGRLQALPWNLGDYDICTNCGSPETWRNLSSVTY